MDRSDDILHYLRTRYPYVHSHDDPDWLAAHPSGFGAVQGGTDPNLHFLVHPARIDELTSHLDNADLAVYLDAVDTWWEYSAQHFVLGWIDVDLIIGMFRQDRPSAAEALLAVADHHGIDLSDFLVR